MQKSDIFTCENNMLPWIPHANACRVWSEFVCDNPQNFGISLKLIHRTLHVCLEIRILPFLRGHVISTIIRYITSQSLANTFTLISENTF